MSPIDTLIESIRQPEILSELSAPVWEQFLHLGRYYGISGRWYDQLEERQLLANIPIPVANNLWADRLLALENERRIRWESDRVQHALAALEVEAILLKGGAYVIQGLAAGLRRLSSDLDILVPIERLGEVEAALFEHGWAMTPVDNYDEHYYREWMHELPPMRHNVRGTWLDVHHNLVPRTSRACPDASSLIERSVLHESTGHRTLSTSDMLIHSILHGFYCGELLNAFRDVLDIHELATELESTDPLFWTEFVSRVIELDVARPAYYALTCSARLFDTQIPTDVLDALSASVPNPVTRIVMGSCIERMAKRGSNPTTRDNLAAKAMLARSHWNKMPPLMLVRHLARKYSKGRKQADGEP